MRFFQPIVIPLILLALWQAVALSGAVSPYLLPSPGQVFNSCLTMAQNGVLLRHLASSLSRIAVGFSLSVALAFLCAGVLSHWPLLDRMLSGSFSFLRMTPPLALTPLLILWLGIEDTTQVAIILLASFFPIYLNTRTGLSSLDDSFRELAESLHLSRTRRIIFFHVPAAVPSILTGLRLGFGYSWRALIAAELIAASSGLGYMIMDAEQMQRADEVIVGILVIGILGWLIDALFSFLASTLLSRRFPEVTEL